MKSIPMFPMVVAMICGVVAWGSNNEKKWQVESNSSYSTAKTVNSDSIAPEDKVYLIVEDQPEPLDGKTAFEEYMKDNLKYPEQARKMGIEGKVFVQFIVTKEGQLKDVAAVKGIGAGCDEEAVRLIKSGPAWKPGRQHGQRVAVRMILPINFKLN